MALKALTIALFVLCLFIGLRLADHNPLENDEIYSQWQSIEGLSFGQILAAKVPEGNNCPLFYLLQKTLFALTDFHLTDPWVLEQDICNDRAQVLLRLLPIIFMSAAICLIWYFFARRYSLTSGFLALALILASPMVWLYFAQARPYSLWTLLTTAQLLLFLSPGKKERWLLAVHWLLCLTTSFGFIQTIIITAFQRPKNLWPTAPAVGLGILYFWHAPHYPFRVPQMGHLIFENFSQVRLAAVAGCAGLVFFLARHKNTAWPRLKFLGAGLIFLLIPLLVIGYYWHLHVPGKLGFELSSRYFIFLTPLASIGFLVFWLDSYKLCPNIWVKTILMEIMAVVIILDGLQAWVVLQRLWV